MTAEVAIMNKTAVALAADSAVTITQQIGPKIYDTANKLFALSKYAPVGIMIYGNSLLMGVPWESIVKIYRKQLQSKTYDRLEEYSNNFIKFLNNDTHLIPKSIQDRHLEGGIYGFFHCVLFMATSFIHLLLLMNEL